MFQWTMDRSDGRRLTRYHEARCRPDVWPRGGSVLTAVCSIVPGWWFVRLTGLGTRLVNAGRSPAGVVGAGGQDSGTLIRQWLCGLGRDNPGIDLNGGYRVKLPFALC